MPIDNKVIIALDFDDLDNTINFLNKFHNEKLYVKVGMELFYSEGINIIKEIKKRGHKIFLDLKLHDIPDTAKKAIKVLGRLDVDMINVHASGGIKMMNDALLELRKINKDCKLIAVTYLTSIDNFILNNELGINKDINDMVLNLAYNTKLANLDGVVCSVYESKLIKEKCGKDFLTITPGIRLEDNDNNDQKRVATPKIAKENLSDYIVVGRSITTSNNPYDVYKKIVEEFK